MMKRIFILFTFLLLTTFLVQAQLPYKRLILEPSLGVTQGYADVRSKASYLAGINVRYSLSNIISLNANGFAGQMRSSNKDIYDRTYRTDYFQFGLRAHVNFASLFDVYHLTHRINPYFSIGLAYMFANARKAADKDIAAQTAFAYKGWTLNYPFGFGLKMYLTPRLDLNICSELVYTRSDSIDGHVANVFSDPTKNNKNLQFNNRIKSDMYFMFTVGLSIKFGKRVHRENEHIEWMPRDLRIDRMIDSLYAEDLKMADRIDSILPDLDSVYQALTVMNDNDIYINNRLDTLGERVNSLEKEIAQFKAAWPIDYIFFDLDKYIIKPRFYESLYNLARLMRAFPSVKVEIIGHTDPRATNEYNVRLSRNRANAVYQFMRYYFDIPETRMQIGYQGEDIQVTPREDEKSYYMSRRVALKLIY